MLQGHDMGWTELDICARAAAELSFGQAAYLGAGLPYRVCDYIPACRGVTFYFGDKYVPRTGAITWDTFIPGAIQYRESKIDIVFLTPCEDAEFPGQYKERVIQPRLSDIGNPEDISRTIVLIPNVKEACDSEILHRLSRFTLDNSDRRPVRIICSLGVFDTTMAGLSVIELAPAVRAGDLRNFLRISPRFAATTSTGNIPTYPQC